MWRGQTNCLFIRSIKANEALLDVGESEPSDQIAPFDPLMKHGDI